MGPGGGLPSYRRDPAKILRDLSLLLQVRLSHISLARLTRFFGVGESNAEKWLTDQLDDDPDAHDLHEKSFIDHVLFDVAIQFGTSNTNACTSKLMYNIHTYLENKCRERKRIFCILSLKNNIRDTIFIYFTKSIF